MVINLNLIQGTDQLILVVKVGLVKFTFYKKCKSLTKTNSGKHNILNKKKT